MVSAYIIFTFAWGTHVVNLNFSAQPLFSWYVVLLA
jgi:hypothetical protein